jgi:hypothetical protein
VLGEDVPGDGNEAVKFLYQTDEDNSGGKRHTQFRGSYPTDHRRSLCRGPSRR